MDLIVFPSPALVNGLLMTEVAYEDRFLSSKGELKTRQRVERFFFGYRCGGCREVFLIRKDTRDMFQIERDLCHDCDPSDLRRSVRNAREMARERDEYIMEGANGGWWPEKRMYPVSKT
jgi:hypothetical protein